MGSDEGWKVGGGGGCARVDLTFIEKDFDKSFVLYIGSLQLARK